MKQFWWRNIACQYTGTTLAACVCVCVLRLYLLYFDPIDNSARYVNKVDCHLDAWRGIIIYAASGPVSADRC